MIASKVISGVTALIIPARIEVTSVSATANRIPGITLSNNETTQRCSHIIRLLGSEIPLKRAQNTNVRAPNETRPNATPIGVRNSRPNLMKIKEQPQTTPKAM
jgi:hypothetical protein